MGWTDPRNPGLSAASGLAQFGQNFMQAYTSAQNTQFKNQQAQDMMAMKKAYYEAQMEKMRRENAPTEVSMGKVALAQKMLKEGSLSENTYNSIAKGEFDKITDPQQLAYINLRLNKQETGALVGLEGMRLKNEQAGSNLMLNYSKQANDMASKIAEIGTKQDQLNAETPIKKQLADAASLQAQAAMLKAQKVGAGAGAKESPEVRSLRDRLKQADAAVLAWDKPTQGMSMEAKQTMAEKRARAEAFRQDIRDELNQALGKKPIAAPSAMPSPSAPAAPGKLNALPFESRLSAPIGSIIMTPRGLAEKIDQPDPNNPAKIYLRPVEGG